MHTNGNEEKGKEGRQEKEVVPFEASSREPSVPKVFATAKTFSRLGTLIVFPPHIVPHPYRPAPVLGR
jgi:hypothetical protein